MTEKRKRGQNFSSEEKDKLIKLLLTYKSTILNKKTDATTNEAKAAAWQSLTAKFNSCGNNYRSKESLIKLWEKLKSESNIYWSANKKSVYRTGGGPSIVKTNPILDKVCTIVGRGCTGIDHVNDSDADMMQTPQENITFEIEDHMSNCPLQELDFEKIETPCQQTPLWMRRHRPQPSNKNERSEASDLINKRRLDTEELKIKLLEEEIKFKNQLHQYQLQTAAVDLQIKQEILAQVKNGSFALSNLFGTKDQN